MPPTSGKGDEIRTPHDILLRASRPQRHSTWIPRRRDWRYTTGVYRHEDFADSPRDRTVWDELDEDIQTGVFGRERKKAKHHEDASVRTPKKPRASSTPKAETQRHSRALTVTRFVHSETSEEEVAAWERTNLLVRLKLSPKGVGIVQGIIDRQPPTHTAVSPATSRPQTSPKNDPKVAAFCSLRSPSSSSLTESVSPQQGYREWKDGTTNFNMQEVKKLLQPQDKPLVPLPLDWSWIPGTPPINALLPPGVPLFLKEILAFYPLHVRWEGAMLRLIQENYQPADIVAIQRWLRAANNFLFLDRHVQSCLGGAMETMKPRLGERLCQGIDPARLPAGKPIEDACGGSVLPNFEDRIRDVKFLPTGPDAWGLTQWLMWYLGIRNSFKPRLDLNVLHVQSLLRALRLPIRVYAPTNLGSNIFEDWKARGRFTERPADDDTSCQILPSKDDMEVPSKSRLEIDTNTGDVRATVVLKARHVLIFPFLAILGMVDRALELGVRKAEEREKLRTERKELILATKQDNDKDSNERHGINEHFKRPRDDDDDQAGHRPTKRPVLIWTRRNGMLLRHAESR